VVQAPGHHAGEKVRAGQLAAEHTAPEARPRVMEGLEELMPRPGRQARRYSPGLDPEIGPEPPAGLSEIF